MHIVNVINSNYMFVFFLDVYTLSFVIEKNVSTQYYYFMYNNKSMHVH